MIPLGLSSSQLGLLDQRLRTHHSIHVTVQVLNLSGDRLADVSSMLIDGQVNIDQDADVTRNLQLALLDPRRDLNFDSDSPSDGALFLDRMVRVVYSVKEPTLGWVDIPVFTGPISKMDRSDDLVTIEAQGKEALAMGAGWVPMTFKRGFNKVEVIEDVMRKRAGETKFSLVERGARLPRDLSLGRMSVPWQVAKSVARSMDLQLFYDGRGTLRLRKLPSKPSFLINDGTGGVITSEPQITYTSENLVNLVWVKGGVPKGGGRQAVSHWRAAPRAHPLSPQRLGRNGVPRYLVEVIDNDSIRTLKEAKALAATRLENRLLQHVDVAVDTLPIPHLEPMDILRVSTSEFAMSFRMRQASIPLTSAGQMSMGYLKRVSINRRNIRRR